LPESVGVCVVGRGFSTLIVLSFSPIQRIHRAMENLLPPSLRCSLLPWLPLPYPGYPIPGVVSVAYIEYVSRGDWWNAENAWGAAPPDGKKPKVGVVGELGWNDGNMVL
jgi:hypothetical protein